MHHDSYNQPKTREVLLTRADFRSIIDGLKSVNPDLAIQLDLLAEDCFQFNLLCNLKK